MKIRADDLPPRALRYMLMAAARTLQPDHRVAHCHVTVTSKHGLDETSGVELMRTKDGRAYFAGLQTCGSVWDCAGCAGKISEKRAWELNHAVNVWHQSNRNIMLGTFTLQHQHADPLVEVLGTLKRAYVSMKERRDFKNLMKWADVEWQVTATEVTHGANGWHPHFHAMYFLNVPARSHQKELERSIGELWRLALDRLGGYAVEAHGFTLQGGNHAADYAAKWGAVRELAKAVTKRARKGGRTPLQLLADYALNDDAGAGVLWREYSDAFYRRQQLVWSKGMKQAFGIDELSDDAIAAAEPEAARWAWIDYWTWRAIWSLGRDIRAELLNACEADDLPRFNALMLEAQLVGPAELRRPAEV